MNGDRVRAAIAVAGAGLYRGPLSHFGFYLALHVFHLRWKIRQLGKVVALRHPVRFLHRVVTAKPVSPSDRAIKWATQFLRFTVALASTGGGFSVMLARFSGG